MSNSLIFSCPHCGGQGELKARYNKKYNTWFVFVKCEICGSQGKLCQSVDNPEDSGWTSKSCSDAVRAWNMRFYGSERHD